MNADKDMGFSALPSHLGALEQKKTSNENCTAIATMCDNVLTQQACSTGHSTGLLFKV
jgi:hypothetical protein